MWLGKQVAVEQAYEMREPVVVTVMGCRRQEQQVVAVLREPLGELVPLRALDLVAATCRAFRVGTTLVGFVDDDEVPPLLPNPFSDARPVWHSRWMRQPAIRAPKDSEAAAGRSPSGSSGTAR